MYYVHSMSTIYLIQRKFICIVADVRVLARPAERGTRGQGEHHPDQPPGLLILSSSSVLTPDLPLQRGNVPTQNISLASSHVDVYQRAGAGDLDSRDIAQWMRDTGEDIDRWAVGGAILTLA